MIFICFEFLLSVSNPFLVKIVGTALLTDEDAAKPKREIVIDLGGTVFMNFNYLRKNASEHQAELPYEPGDAFYFITPNPAKEVNFILDRFFLFFSLLLYNTSYRLGLIYVADRQLTLSVHPQTKKLNACIPEYLQQVSSLRHLFTWCLDIRRAPGRVEASKNYLNATF